MPYAGPCASALGPRGGAAHLDVAAMTALLALLPGVLQPGVLCNHLPADEAKMVWGGICVGGRGSAGGTMLTRRLWVGQDVWNVWGMI